MAADDDKGEAPDPWADLVADELTAGGEEPSFTFDDLDADSAVDLAAIGSEDIESAASEPAEQPVVPDMISAADADVAAEIAPDVEPAIDLVAESLDTAAESLVSADAQTDGSGIGFDAAAFLAEEPESTPPVDPFAESAPAVDPFAESSSAVDPFAEIAAEADLAEAGSEETPEPVAFGDPVEASAEDDEPVSVDEPASGMDAVSGMLDSEPQAAADSDVDAWLSGADEADAGPPPLSVFAPDDAAGEPLGASASSVEIGTGFSGLGLSDGTESETAAEGIDGWDGLGVEQEEQQLSEETLGVEAEADDADQGQADVAPVLAGAAAAAAAAPVAKRAAKAKKSGGVGQMVGVVAGGVLALPITFAILLWGFQKDPFGIRKLMPAQLAFLLPEKLQPGYKKPKPAVDAPASGTASTDASAAPSLDDLAAATPPVKDPNMPADPAAPSAPPTGDAPATPPAPSDPGLPTPDPFDLGDAPKPPKTPPAADPLAVDPLAPPQPMPAKPAVPATDPSSDDPFGLDAPKPGVPKPATPVPDPLVPEPPAPVPPPPPPPEPLDTSALETSVADASTKLDSAAEVEDATTLPGKKSLVAWYKSLALVADEMVRLENEAEETGRPLGDAAEHIARLHQELAAETKVADELAHLARHWLEYGRRPNEGVVLPVTFAGARKVGPYWRSQVTLEDGDETRELAVISRKEPEAVAGDRLVITGIVFDKDVLWAADIRAAEPADKAAVDF